MLGFFVDVVERKRRREGREKRQRYRDRKTEAEREI
jgi:hypothetical protein